MALQYRGRFALDFAYDSWAEAYREIQHSAYLELMERAVAADTHSGHFDRAISLAQTAAAVDPDAEQFEYALIKLYRLTGSHAAAAEQYSHYAAVLRDQLGAEAPPLESI